MTEVTTGPAASRQTLRLSLPPGPRPAPPGALSASAAFGWRALLKIKHVPEQLFDVIAIPVVFTLMFTYLFGGALAGSASRYLQFILPGTLVMAVLLVTMYAGVGLNADASKGVSDRFRSLPIWRPAPIAGALLVRAEPLVGLDHPRPAHAHPAGGHERRYRCALPADAGEQRLRAAPDHARLAAGLRQNQPG